MKRLINLFTILLLTNAVSAQLYGGLLNYFYEKPAYEFREEPFAVKQGTDGRFVYDLTPQKFKILLNEKSMKDYLSKKTYSFFSTDKFYMLSYEDMEFTQKQLIERPQTRKERKLYLYRLDDNGWTIACNKPVMVGYVDRTSYVSYFPWRTSGDMPNDEKQIAPAKNGGVDVSPEGVVTMVLINHRSDNLDKIGSTIIFFNSIVVFTPNPDGTYKVHYLK
jgi:hypothetical protein